MKENARFDHAILWASMILALMFLSLEVLPGNAQELPPLMGTAMGTVVNRTSGESAPTDIPVTLYALENFSPVDIYTTTVGMDGSFFFSSVELVKDRTYVTTLEYQGVSYGSSFVTFDGVGDTLQLDIEAYEATNDPAVVSVERLHIMVEFGDNSMTVSELYIFDNQSDRVYTGLTGRPDEGTLSLPIAEGALDASVERSMGDSMVPASGSMLMGDGEFLDTLPVRPGQGSQQLMLSYQLPYAGEATVSHELPYALSNATLFLPVGDLSVESTQLVKSGDASTQGMPYARWDGANIAAGETLSFRISGEIEATGLMPGSASPAESDGDMRMFPLSVDAGDNTISLAIGAGGLILAIALVGLFWRRHIRSAHKNARQYLLEAIVDLDDLFEAGEISAARYELERERLKTELAPHYLPDQEPH